jgi:hypothetical protein
VLCCVVFVVLCCVVLCWLCRWVVVCCVLDKDGLGGVVCSGTGKR